MEATKPPRISDIKRAISARHGVRSRLVAAEHVTCRTDDGVVWESDVLVFRLVDHPIASKCYVWEMHGELQIVLHAPFTSMPEEAVRRRMEEVSNGTRKNPIEGNGGVMPTSEITLVARVEAKPGLHHLVREELVKLLAPTREEPGCARFELHQTPDDPTVFFFYETWRSKEDFERYLESPFFKSWCLGCEELVARRPEISRWDRIA